MLAPNVFTFVKVSEILFEQIKLDCGGIQTPDNPKGKRKNLINDK